jgi:protein involved in polysaccharide export with SLBB domain
MPMGEVVVVRAGDQIFLRPGQVVYVEGQIARPGAITLATGLTATQALALAGGPTATANLRAVLVNRADGSKVRLNVNRVHRGVAEDVVLGSDDHLIVPLNPF